MVISSSRHVVIEAVDQESTVAKTTSLDHVGKAAFATWALLRAELRPAEGSAYSCDIKHFLLTVRR